MTHLVILPAARADLIAEIEARMMQVAERPSSAIMVLTQQLAKVVDALQ